MPRPGHAPAAPASGRGGTDRRPTRDPGAPHGGTDYSGEMASCPLHRERRVWTDIPSGGFGHAGGSRR